MSEEKQKAPGKILGVAVRQNGVMICLPKPNRHHDCIRYAIDVLGLEKPIGGGEDNQGFYTDQGYFLRRKPAMMQARIQNILITDTKRSILFSEDLW